MKQDEVQNIIDYAYPKIKAYYGKGNKAIPTIELHKDIYARLSGIEGMEGEASQTSIAEYDEIENKIFIYYPNVKSEEDVLRSLIHEYTYYTQNLTPIKKRVANQEYTYETNPYEIEAHSAEKDWQLFSKK